MSAPRKRAPYRKSPAVAVLRANGATVKRISELSGVDQSTISHQLLGDARLRASVHVALIDAVGPLAALDVISAIPARRRPPSSRVATEPSVEQTQPAPVAATWVERIRAFAFGNREVAS